MLTTFKWCFGDLWFLILIWCGLCLCLVLWNRQILSPKTLQSAFESEFLSGLELWSLSLSGWHIYIWKQIPIKGLGFIVKHFKTWLLFHSLLQTLRFFTKNDAVWHLEMTEKRESSKKKNPWKQTKTHSWVQREWICASPPPLTEVVRWNLSLCFAGKSLHDFQGNCFTLWISSS